MKSTKPSVQGFAARTYVFIIGTFLASAGLLRAGALLVDEHDDMLLVIGVACIVAVPILLALVGFSLSRGYKRLLESQEESSK